MTNHQATQSRQFQIVFEKYYSSLCNYAFSFLKDTIACEDIVQEIFIKIWENRPDLIASDTVRFYLFTAVRNNCITQLRKEKKGVLVEFTDQDGGDAAEGPPIFREEGAAQKDYSSLLAEGIRRLPPKCREVFILTRSSNMTYQQTADSLGISIKTVENQVGKALKLLRVYLNSGGLYFLCLMINFIG